MTTRPSWQSGFAVASFIASVATTSSAWAADVPDPTAGPPTVAMTPARPKLLLGTDTQVDVTLDVRGPESETFAPVRALVLDSAARAGGAAAL